MLRLTYSSNKNEKKIIKIEKCSFSTISNDIIFHVHLKFYSKFDICFFSFNFFSKDFVWRKRKIKGKDTTPHISKLLGNKTMTHLKRKISYIGKNERRKRKVEEELIIKMVMSLYGPFGPIKIDIVL